MIGDCHNSLRAIYRAFSSYEKREEVCNKRNQTNPLTRKELAEVISEAERDEMIYRNESMGNVTTDRGYEIMGNVTDGGDEIMGNVTDGGDEIMGNVTDGGYEIMGNVTDGGYEIMGNVTDVGYEIIGNVTDGGNDTARHTLQRELLGNLHEGGHSVAVYWPFVWSALGATAIVTISKLAWDRYKADSESYRPVRAADADVETGV
eukprot:Blabericola_migrator_1__2060@NODE_1566_length_4265_cov_44_717723_g713_i1_p2_GENE_NODE_1566_length_4265_cov_44_717723_g713_i1NODE_1566_length_4265_cov_44_717723_g713_i1_p2_ORF_typecomplete_len205_score37_58Cdc6_C/PF09079_11/0_12CcmD/PF04995_14/0_4Rep_facA_3/PF08661_11/9_6e02Rep_facA_3/PF08661_11/14Rep_facA_3/PF08661_11/29Pox_A12/PF04651_13/18HCV_NS5a_1a/PF08300_13/1_6e02HCV_NS5a_1a/PF08300_13/10HCV_NS5a_1a/PF08300_13/3_6e02_NODE_1566_length_4265_cov_44_717723_g713_i1324938